MARKSINGGFNGKDMGRSSINGRFQGPCLIPGGHDVQTWDFLGDLTRYPIWDPIACHFIMGKIWEKLRFLT